MPVEWEIDGRLCVVRCQGAYSTDELLGALDAVASAPCPPGEARMLLDLRKSESVLGRSIPNLRRVASAFVECAGHFGNRCALLVSGTARYGLMRMASMWVDARGVDARVFRDEAAARKWLLGTSSRSRPVVRTPGSR